MGQHAALLSLRPGIGPVHSRLRTSSRKTAAFQRVSYCSVWGGSACTDFFYRKHFQAHVLDVLISERQSIKVAKIMLYNSRNLRKATSSSYRLVQTLKASSARGVVGAIRASPSRSEVSSLAHYFLKRTVIATCTLLSAAVFLIPQTTGPEVPWISLKTFPQLSWVDEILLGRRT